MNRVIVAPITSKIKNIFDFDCLVIVQGRKGKIMLDQIRTVDKSRLKQKIASIDSQTLKNLEEALRITLDLV